VREIDFFDMYAPVVNWLIVRLMLVSSEILGLATKQVDYTAAFIHAPIDRDPNWDSMTKEEQSRSGIYVQMPRGFGQAGKVLKLKKSLYGLRQAPRNFFLHLKAQLEAIGFKSQEDFDPCLFMLKNVICLVYVDAHCFTHQRWSILMMQFGN
jgi:Reverse transcriptase (RNA-dependent DNA polymerase)